MRIILFAAVALAIGSSAVQAEELAALPRAEGARFAAMSLTDAQGARAIISNVLATANGTHLAPCQVQVSFFGADGSLIGNPPTVDLKVGDRPSVPVADPPLLGLGVVRNCDVVDLDKVCELK